MKIMWINQPATTQPFHDMHGTLVLALEYTDTCYQILFLKGNKGHFADIQNMCFPKLCLSEGWPKHLRE